MDLLLMAREEDVNRISFNFLIDTTTLLSCSLQVVENNIVFYYLEDSEST